MTGVSPVTGMSLVMGQSLVSGVETFWESGPGDWEWDGDGMGMEWEWTTRVSVVKEGNFTRSGTDEVDEAEIFEGGENKLEMIQAYTWEFQCQYELQRYPFDKQVTDSL